MNYLDTEINQEMKCYKHKITTIFIQDDENKTIKQHLEKEN